MDREDVSVMDLLTRLWTRLRCEGSEGSEGSPLTLIVPPLAEGRWYAVPKGAETAGLGRFRGKGS